ncbi:MAG: vanadium-dependent haloperoxidase [Bacteroidota bacterium]|nr:vanadium-dependent haloperoxidase [Bacteroidota bacterium]MDP4246296.1 vanadium-dependent haloperoxidase [Bacteroidota bacterium]MDP4254583.1 vanadium-dependent haloperoxidase [Bacteroidota bacterium]
MIARWSYAAGFLLVLLITGRPGFTQPGDAAPLHRAESAITDIMVHDIFSPPVASRIYLYTNIAAYEALAKAHPGQYASLYGQIRSFPHIPAPAKLTRPSLSAVYAFMLVSKRLLFSEQAVEDSTRAILKNFHVPSAHISPALYSSSLAYGRQVADSVIRWAEMDQYRETRKLPRYRLVNREGKWVPTPPAYMAAIEPYWNKIRLIALDTCSQFRPPPPPAFSKDSGSAFYILAYDVYQTGNHLTADQKDLANFWDCNPFAVSMEGHLHFALKKISPGGHWISIVGIVARQQHMDMIESAALYTLTSIALFDAFISCWDEKYRTNVIRPETYIDAYIDETWRPVLQTPPFPEYTSGHSVISSAAAQVLTSWLGDHYAFDDSSEQEFGLPVRHFNSFTEASAEAAVSRLYGGIHYRPAIGTGLLEGRQIGEWVVKKIRLKK